eukprot:3837-Pelagococcus_subviridis.AAC.1
MRRPRRRPSEVDAHERGADRADEHRGVEPREKRPLVGEERLRLDAHRHAARDRRRATAAGAGATAAGAAAGE